MWISPYCVTLKCYNDVIHLRACNYVVFQGRSSSRLILRLSLLLFKPTTLLFQPQRPNHDVSGAYAECLFSLYIDVCEVTNVENLHTFMHEEWEVEVNLGLFKDDAKEKSIGL